MQRTLQPIIHRTLYTRVVEKVLVEWLRETVFTPLLLTLEEHNQRDNEHASALIAALNSGAVHYAAGVFSGSFNAAISRELLALGARFAADKTFRLEQTKLPYYLRAVVESSIHASALAHQGVIDTVAEILNNIGSVPSLEIDTTPVIADLNKQFHSTIAPVTRESMHIPWEPSPGERKALDASLTHNAELSIVNFAQERLPVLRARVEQNLAEGGRAEKLALILEAEFGMAQRKAEFIADQETGLLVSKYRQIRYENLGVQEYIWMTSHDERVRPDHVALEGRQFAFSSPPITDRATGARNNPGEDYRCRCVARPIINLVEA